MRHDESHSRSGISATVCAALDRAASEMRSRMEDDIDRASPKTEIVRPVQLLQAFREMWRAFLARLGLRSFLWARIRLIRTKVFLTLFDSSHSGTCTAAEVASFVPGRVPGNSFLCLALSIAPQSWPLLPLAHNQIPITENSRGRATLRQPWLCKFWVAARVRACEERTLHLILGLNKVQQCSSHTS